MPLMGKKSPTPQELYRARKQREEEEKESLLPPGLVNHGNTCFMNSVLQGLIATPMLSDIVRFSLPESYYPITSRRSPQLTNGHGRGGEDEKEWESGMPLGDVFTAMMEKAWSYQEERRRQSLTPRAILERLGAKYDQYLDFRQQDAHEFLRHLLDAMRMEELDIIKKRQPPAPPKAKRRRKPHKPTPQAPLLIDTQSPTPTPTNDPGPSEIPDPEQLTSFVDMAFGGTLASILVCEKCKKISCNYEDFNDLSLSIKPEDYAVARARAKAWRRERLRGFAKRIKTGVAGVSGSGKGQNGKKSDSEEKTRSKNKSAEKGKTTDEESKPSKLGVGLTLNIPTDSEAEGDTVLRASSVPTSPTRRSLELERVVAVGDVPRRRSLDFDREEGVSSEQLSFSTVNGALSEGHDVSYGSRHLRIGAEADSGIFSETEVEVISASEADGSGSTPTDAEDKEREKDQTSSSDQGRAPPPGTKEHVSWREDVKKSSDRKFKDEEVDGWVKLGRRISMRLTTRTGRSRKKVEKVEKKDGEKEKKEESSKESGVESKEDKDCEVEDQAAPTVPPKDTPLPTSSTEPSLVVPTPVRPSVTPSVSTSILPKFSLHRPSSARATTSGSLAQTSDTAQSSIPVVSGTPRSSSPLARASSPLQLADVARAAFDKHRPDREKEKRKSKEVHKQVEREKSGNPSQKRKWKPTREEEAYLRRLLADVPSSSSPFNLFRNHSSAPTAESNSAVFSSTSNGSGTSFGMGLSHSLSFWSRMGNVQSVEDCLRMFTAVEVMDGDNMVRCRRCWKIQNGVEGAAKRRGFQSGDDSSSDDEDGSESESESDNESGKEGGVTIARVSDDGDSFHVSPATTFTTVQSPMSSALDLDGVSIRSAPTTMYTESTVTAVDDGDLPTPLVSPKFLPDAQNRSCIPVPSISMTSAESSTTIVDTSSGGDADENPSAGSPEERSPNLKPVDKLSSPSRDSLQLPQPNPRHATKRDADRRAIYIARADSSASSRNGTDTESDSESSDSGEMSASVPSGRASARSSSSSIAIVQPNSSPQESNSPPSSSLLPISKPTPITPTPTQTSIPRSKQFVLRRAYKRYLVAQPPPVLVIHLKRFQQVGKLPMPAQMQFFANFKKLDDPVAFPEYLDLSPFLVPRRESFGLKPRKGEKQMWEKASPAVKEKDGKFMYRLYAVVVHIGNMLGGHYIAYTALPDNEDYRTSEDSVESAPAPVPKDSPTPTTPPASEKSVTLSAPSESPRPSVSRTTSFVSHSDPKHNGKATGPSRKWCYISDQVVRLVTLEEVMKAKAYICMYERV